MRDFTVKVAAPYDVNQPLRGCITTNGGESDVHPSGRRSFNLQELACLAGFPQSHAFKGCKTSIRRQIGNAVPPPVAKAVFKQVIETMRQTDNIEAVWEPEVIDLD